VRERDRADPAAMALKDLLTLTPVRLRLWP
jgi:hypothetical protein